MNAAEFLVELRRRAPLCAAPEEPLERAQQFIDANGYTGEGRALLAVIKALWTGEGRFSISDLHSFSNKSLALIPSLIDARLAGRYPEWRWHRASSYPPWRFLRDLQKKYGIS